MRYELSFDVFDEPEFDDDSEDLEDYMVRPQTIFHANCCMLAILCRVRQDVLQFPQLTNRMFFFGHMIVALVPPCLYVCACMCVLVCMCLYVCASMDVARLL